MLRINRGVDLRALAENLSRHLYDSPPEHVLSPEILLVQNYGMARWLSLFLAKQEGIAANLQFKFPAEIYWQVMRVMDDDIPEQLPSERMPMHWAIYNILGQENDSSLALLYQYVHHNDPKQQEMRRWNLAGRIADVFDQYLTYRPQMLLGWERKNPEYTTKLSSEQWQAVLWRKLTERWKIGDKKGGSHRASLHKKVLTGIDNGQIPTEKLPNRLTVFGVSEMPEPYIQMLVKLSTLMDVTVYIIDIVHNADNQLVQSLGQATLDFDLLLDKHIHQNRSKIDLQTHQMDDHGPDHPNLFQLVKSGLLKSDDENSLAEFDYSFRIHACHSRRREVEVLHDRLVAAFNENEQLQPHGVRILAPNINDYRADIDAVFGASEPGLPDIPYTIAERAAAGNEAEQAFRALLRLPNTRYKVSQVVDVLAKPPVMKQFAISEEQLQAVLQWIDETNIRWGINGTHKTDFDVPGSDRFTWQAGLDQMMLGLSMQPEHDALFNGIYPYEEIQQYDTAALLGRFNSCLQKLFAMHDDCQTARTASEWRKLLIGWVHQFLPDDRETMAARDRLVQLIEKWSGDAALANNREPVGFSIVQRALLSALDTGGTQGGRPGRGIQFGSLASMRHLPADFMGVLGLNDGEFPSSEMPTSFDLLQRHHEVGDRQHAAGDRQLFLEAICATNTQLHLSYVGQSNRQEAALPPSVVVQELLDYLDDALEITTNDITYHHPLQPFSISYFDNTFPLLSYSSRNKKAAQQLLEKSESEAALLNNPLSEAARSVEQLAFNDLVQFYRHPARYFLQQRMGIYLPEAEKEHEDREAFSLGGLTGYSLGQELISRDTTATPEFKAVVRARGQLPEGWPGDQAFEEKQRTIQAFKTALHDQLGASTDDKKEVQCTINGTLVTAHLGHFYEQGRAFYRFGQARAKDCITLWLNYLIESISGFDQTRQSRLFTTFGNKAKMVVHRFSPVDDAAIQLKHLLQLYSESHLCMPPLFQESSYAYAEAISHGKNEATALDAAQRKWYNAYRPYGTDAHDRYNTYITQNNNPLANKSLQLSFKKKSMAVWGPYFSHVQTEKITL